MSNPDRTSPAENHGPWTYKVHPDCCTIFRGAEEVGRVNSAASAARICLACNGRSQSEKDDDETYEIGKRDGYEEAIQKLDVLTGGDGEFRGSTFPGETVDVPVMEDRIVARLNSQPVTVSEVAEAIGWTLCGHASEKCPCGSEAKVVADAILSKFNVSRK